MKPFGILKNDSLTAFFGGCAARPLPGAEAQPSRDPAPAGTGAVHTVALLVNHIGDAYENAVFAGASAFARQHGLNLTCFVGGEIDAPVEHHARRNDVFTLASLYNVDGIVSVSNSLGAFAPRERMEGFLRSFDPLPAVSVGLDVGRGPCLLADGLAGLRALLHHLIEVHQARRIAFIGGPPRHAEAAARYEAYRSVLAERSLPFDEALVLPGLFTQASGEQAIGLLLDERRVRCDAICAANDHMAVGAVRELEARGIAVPEDVIVTGFDDAPEYLRFAPRLTTVRRPAFEAGYKAVELLHASFAGGNAPAAGRIEFASETVIGESCGCHFSGGAGPRRAEAAGGADGPGPFPSSFGAVPSRAVLEAGEALPRAVLETGEALLSASSWDDLRLLLRDALPRFHAGSCYVSLYEERNGFPPGSFARLVAAVENNEPVAPPSAPERFLTEELVPGGLKAGRGKIYLVMPLFSPGRQRGFVVYEIGRSCVGALENLTLEINNTVNRIDAAPEPTAGARPRPGTRKAAFIPASKYEKSKPSYEQAVHYYRKIVRMMEKRKIYRRPDLSIRGLSRLTRIPCHNISYVINTHANNSFYSFVNAFRVREAIAMLQADPERKMIDIAFAAGFKAKSTFNKAFREYTGFAPSAYVGRHRQKES